MNFQFIFKVTKACNLRCRYCLESEYFNDRRKMNLGDVETILSNVAAYLTGKKGNHYIKFYWHGGEPMLQPPSFYRGVSELQERLFTENIEYSNVIQTNLTIPLSEEYLQLFKDGFFQSIGVSYDVYGDNRIFKNGIPSQPRVLRNLETLEGLGMTFQFICTLSRQNIGRIKDIYTFFNGRKWDFKVIPVIYLGPKKQLQKTSILPEEYIEAMKTLFDTWFYDEKTNIVVGNFIEFLSYLQPQEDPTYNMYSACQFQKSCLAANIFRIDPDGDVSICSAFNERRADYSFGNIYRDSFLSIIDSPKRKKLFERYASIKKQCKDCEYFEGCFGGCLYSASLTGDWRNKSPECGYYYALYKHIDDALHNAKVVVVP